MTLTRDHRKPAAAARQTLSWETLRAVFGMKEREAARALRVSLKVLKTACRLYGVRRWPFRKLSSIKTALRKLDEVYAKNERLQMRIADRLGLCSYLEVESALIRARHALENGGGIPESAICDINDLTALLLRRVSCNEMR